MKVYFVVKEAHVTRRYCSVWLIVTVGLKEGGRGRLMAVVGEVRDMACGMNGIWIVQR